jgi:damage-control phosphatase, subfamily I
MIPTSECMLCAQRVALEAARHADFDVVAVETVASKITERLKSAVSEKEGFCPVGIGMMEAIQEVTGCSDPYKDLRRRNTQVAEQVISAVREAVETSSDPLWEACRAAVLGNRMDVMARAVTEFGNIKSFLDTPFAVNHFEQFRSALQKAGSVVYLADNAGEVFFDRILIERIRVEKGDIPIEYYVKGFPFQSDAQYEDVAPAMIDEVATIRIVPLNKRVFTKEGYHSLSMYEGFLSRARKADLVVAKGQANHDLFAPLQLGAFYLFVHKCPVIALAERANIGEAAFLRR